MLICSFDFFVSGGRVFSVFWGVLVGELGFGCYLLEVLLGSVLYG